jgi:hypothetical protein
MIAKAQAGVIQSAAIASTLAAIPQRIEDAIRLAAAAGQVSIVFAYAPATSAQADAFITSTMAPAGWTCVNNNIAQPGNFTITVS